MSFDDDSLFHWKEGCKWGHKVARVEVRNKLKLFCDSNNHNQDMSYDQLIVLLGLEESKD